MDYKLMCFPCLRRKKKMSSLGSSSTDMDERFEYIVDKYTIRKIPLCTTVTSPDELMRQRTVELHPKLSFFDDGLIEEKAIGDYTDLTMLSEAYSVPRVTPVLPVTTHSSRSVKEKPRPTDILDPTSQVPRRAVAKPNYVVIPSKASLHAKDIMLTKREITNQYLNNFSSVFVDNLKDQVPKDPETMPKLSRPYTSAIKNLPLGGNLPSTSRRKSDSVRSKVRKLVYSLPDGNIVETAYEPDENAATTDEDVPVHSPVAVVDGVDGHVPFRTRVKSQVSDDNNNNGPESRPSSSHTRPETASSYKQITYEDIQALDVGYEFSQTEKYGVKPKMTRIRITSLDVKDAGSPRSGQQPGHMVPSIDSDYARRFGETSDALKASRSRSQSQTPLVTAPMKPRTADGSSHSRSFPAESAGADDTDRRLRYFLTDTCYMPHSVSAKINVDPTLTVWDRDAASATIQDHFSEDKDKNESDYPESSLEMNEDKQSESFPKVKPCARTFIQSYRPSSSDRSGANTGGSSDRAGKGTLPFPFGGSVTDQTFPYKSAMVHRSLSYDSLHSSRKGPQTGGASSPSKVTPFLRFDRRPEEQETETSNSLYSRESKTSSLVTSPVTSDPEVNNKKATLRWKIIIKHHKDESGTESGRPNPDDPGQ